MRIVHGLPTSWEQSITTTMFPKRVDIAAWSPCSRFVAVSWSTSESMVEIWDAIRFGQPTTLELPLGELGGAQQLIFSPDGCFLTWFGTNPGKFISWDIQTGVLVSAIPSGQQGDKIHCTSITYSTCGTMFGASFHGDNLFTIHTYNVFSGTHLHSHSIEGPTLRRIWTHGDFFQTGTVEPGSLTIWETKFASIHKPKKVASLCMNDDNFISSEGTLFHPTTSRIAIRTERSISIWSPQDKKILLDSSDPSDSNKMWMSFSADGHFFACGITVTEIASPEIYLWKESPTGYVLHQKLLPNTGAFKPLLSPNGDFIIGFGATAIQLWHTASATSPPTDLPQVSQRTFILGFSPDRKLAGVTRMGEKVVKVLDLKSGTIQLIINVGIQVYGLRVSENTIVIVGKRKIVTWNLPAGDCIPNLQVDINDSVQTTTFSHPWISTVTKRPTISVSPNLCHVAIVELKRYGNKDNSLLHLYDASTGQCLWSVPAEYGDTPWFTLDGGEIWCVTASNTAGGWRIVGGSGSDNTKLEYVGSVAHPPDGFPWNPPDGYEVMSNQWIFHPNGERLLWLPSHWQLFEWQRLWDGQFLALLHDGLPEALILELE